MREFFIDLFETRQEPFDVTLYSIWHILYAVTIFTAIIGMAFYLRKKDISTKERVLNIIAYAIAVVYIGDFFIQPLFRDGAMNVDKLPFHICTLLCPVIAFTQFNKRFACIKEPVAFLSIISPLMYIVYPGSALGTESPFCYEIIQTFVYHGLLLAYGVLLITTQTVMPNIRNRYKSLIGIVITMVWAAFGNVVYSEEGWGKGFDWFFITGKTFPFVPPILMPLAVAVCTFGMVIVIYGLYYWLDYIFKRHKAKVCI